jgi:hypothetical protein
MVFTMKYGGVLQNVPKITGTLILQFIYYADLDLLHFEPQLPSVGPSTTLPWCPASPRLWAGGFLQLKFSIGCDTWKEIDEIEFEWIR